MQLSRREQAMRKSLENKGVHFIPPTFELPNIPVHGILFLSGKISRGKYYDDTIMVYLQDGELYVPDVNALDERALNALLQFL